MAKAKNADVERLREALKTIIPNPLDGVPFPSLAAVQRVMDDRRNRARHFPADIFADPAWDILLELFQAELEQRRAFITDLSERTGVPATTTQRWINIMAASGILIRRRIGFDGRRVFVELSPSGSLSLRRYFADLD